MKKSSTRPKRVCYTYRVSPDAVTELRTFCRFAGWQRDIDNVWHALFAGKRKQRMIAAHLLTDKTISKIGGQPAP